jgi:hypothetical protein
MPSVRLMDDSRSFSKPFTPNPAFRPRPPMRQRKYSALPNHPLRRHLRPSTRKHSRRNLALRPLRRMRVQNLANATSRAIGSQD